ncbi:hypothetical protein JTB14_009805 [Gonioctena quinquepunctata]|nr:hypothetical protein JTB14_009805 [Gonioctena quinquepunctata]
MMMGIVSSGIEVTADAIKTKLLQDICVEKSKKRSAMFGYGNKNCSDSGTHRSRERKYVIANSSSYTRNGSKGTDKRPRCYKCNRYAGHIAKNCDENSSKKQVFVQKSDKSEFTMFTALSALVKSTGNDWFLDSGCSSHLTVDESNFISEETSSKLTITAPNDQQMETDCVGDNQLPVRIPDQYFIVNVENVFYVPDLKVNLFSKETIVLAKNPQSERISLIQILYFQGKQQVFSNNISEEKTKLEDHHRLTMIIRDRLLLDIALIFWFELFDITVIRLALENVNYRWCRYFSVID